MAKSTQYVLSVLVENNSGVLIRIAGLFSRRGYNIKSLNVAETENKEYSRMTIVVESDDEKTVHQIEKQLRKLYDVRDVKQLDDAVCREQLIIKAGNDATCRQHMIEVANLFGAKIVNVAQQELMFELTGEPEKINAFIDLLRPYHINKLVRTGISALERD
ncbi:MAG: acetolactate synthase small subunit [Clostridiales bacterium]|nr:acetolactate synthase small subunit [Clostridiales bacterium]